MEFGREEAPDESEDNDSPGPGADKEDGGRLSRGLKGKREMK